MEQSTNDPLNYSILLKDMVSSFGNVLIGYLFIMLGLYKENPGAKKFSLNWDFFKNPLVYLKAVGTSSQQMTALFEMLSYLMHSKEISPFGATNDPYTWYPIPLPGDGTQVNSGISLVLNQSVNNSPGTSIDDKNLIGIGMQTNFDLVNNQTLTLYARIPLLGLSTGATNIMTLGGADHEFALGMCIGDTFQLNVLFPVKGAPSINVYVNGSKSATPYSDASSQINSIISKNPTLLSTKIGDSTSITWSDLLIATNLIDNSGTNLNTLTNLQAITFADITGNLLSKLKGVQILKTKVPYQQSVWNKSVSKWEEETKYEGIWIISKQEGTAPKQYGLYVKMTNILLKGPVRLPSAGSVSQPYLQIGSGVDSYSPPEFPILTDESETPDKNWTNSETPLGLYVWFVSGAPGKWNAEPEIDAVSIGLTYTDSADGLLFSAGGIGFQGIDLRFALNTKENTPFTWGLVTKLDNLIVPLSTTMSKSGKKTNPIVSDLLMGDTGQNSGTISKAGTVFSISYALDMEGKSAVQLYNSSGKATTGPIWFPLQKKKELAKSISNPWMKKEEQTAGISEYGISLAWGDEEKMLALLFDAELEMGPIEISGMGLGLKAIFDSTSQTPVFESVTPTLEGISVSVKDKKFFSLTGGLLKTEPAVGKVEYTGELLFTVKDIALMMYGAYGTYTPDPVNGLGGNPYTSFFGYLQLGDNPSGNSASPVSKLSAPNFQLTSVSVGFGYNMELSVPSISDIPKFPLVTGQSGTKGSQGSGTHNPLAALSSYIVMKEREYWAAAGIQFTTYEIVRSSILLVVEWGNDLIVQVLGLSTLTIPAEAENGKSGIKPVAIGQLAIKALFDQNKGVLSVQARLTPESYLLDQKMRLTGGFAFYTWFGSSPYAGDWVISLGGYNPYYQKPTHYPSVTGLGFNWESSSSLTYKGGAYFALTPAAVMLGGFFMASFQHKKWLKAWFDLNINVLIQWKPFYYDFTASISVGVTFSKKVWFVNITVSLSLGIGVHIWGPNFAGEATIHVVFFTISIPFGAGSKPGTNPIPWSEFKSSFLPAGGNSKYLDASVTSGLNKDLSKVSSTSGLSWTVSGDNASFLVKTVVPVSGALAFNKKSIKQSGKAVGVGPVGVDKLISNFSVSLTKKDKATNQNVAYNDVLTEVHSIPAPKGLWYHGTSEEVQSSQLGCESMIPDVVHGLRIKRAAHRPDITLELSVQDLGQNIEAFKGNLLWIKADYTTKISSASPPWDTALGTTGAGTKMAGELTALQRLDPRIPNASEITVSNTYADSLLDAPEYCIW
jgi:hypothetical protein